MNLILLLLNCHYLVEDPFLKLCGGIDRSAGKRSERIIPIEHKFLSVFEDCIQVFSPFGDYS